MGRRLDELDRRLTRLVYGQRVTPVAAAAPTATAAVGGRVVLAPRSAGLAGWPIGVGPALAGVDGPYFDGSPPWFDRDYAMTVPAIKRCRDLICVAVGALPFTMWTVDYTKAPAVERQVPPASWMRQPDPAITRQWMLAWTTDDLMFYGQAHWEITARMAEDNRPRAFRRLEPKSLAETASGLEYTNPHTGERRSIAYEDLIQFDSATESILAAGWRTISISVQLDAAADRFASVEIPAGVLEEQDGSEDMSADELAELAATFTAARRSNTTAALNKYVRYTPTAVDASGMQLVEARTYQALEAARLCNVPPYLVGAPAGTGMTYLNGQQARQDLVDFGAAAYIGCIEQTLSADQVTARGQSVRLDQNAWLRNPFTTSATGQPSPNDMQIADPTQTVEVPAP